MTSTEAPGPTRPQIPFEAAYDRRSFDGNGYHPEQSFRGLVRRMARRRRAMFGAAAVTFTLIAIYAFVATPRYASEARLRIESKQAQLPSLTSLVSDQAGGGNAPAAAAAGGAASLLGLGRDELETEIGVLKSDRITDAMIDSLALGVRLTTPADNRARVLSARVLDPNIDVDGKLTLKRQDDGRYSLSSDDLDDAGPLPAIVTPGSPLRVGGEEITFVPNLRSGGPSKIVITLLPRYKVHKLLEKRLVIERQEGGSRLVEISFEDPDRQLAAKVVQRLVSEYVAYTVGTERAEDVNRITELRQQVDSTFRELSAAEVSLRAFEERSRLVAPDDQATAQVKRIAAIGGKLDDLVAERDALQRMLKIIEQRARGGADASAYRQIATFPTLISNRGIQDLTQSLLDLENKRSAIGVRRTDQNEEYRQLTQRIGEIEQQLFTVGPQYRESLDQQIATTRGVIAALNDSLGSMPAATMQYFRHLRERRLLEATYLALQKQLKEAELKDVLRQDRVKVVDTPRVANPKDKAFPKKMVMLMLGALLSVALAITIGLLLELWEEPAYVPRDEPLYVAP